MYFHIINFANICDGNVQMLWSLSCETEGKKNVENQSNICRNQVTLPPHNNSEVKKVTV